MDGRIDGLEDQPLFFITAIMPSTCRGCKAFDLPIHPPICPGMILKTKVKVNMSYYVVSNVSADILDWLNSNSS